MRQLNVKLTEKQHEALRHYATRRRTPVAWLIKDYVDALVARELDAEVRAHEPTQLAAHGGAFDWLADEPDVYTWEDGEAVVPTQRAKRRGSRDLRALSARNDLRS